MSKAFNSIKILIVPTLLLFFTTFSNQILALSSEWVINDKSKVRLISAKKSIDNTDEIILGLEYQLEPGWKTYWKSPGGGGFPQKIVWNNSNNIKDIAIDWPTPKEFEISEKIYTQFENYLQEGDFNFSVYSEEVVSLLEEALQEESYFENMESDIEKLKANILANKKQDLFRYKSEIRSQLIDDLILRKFYRSGVIEYGLKTDSYVTEALKLLASADERLETLEKYFSDDSVGKING